MEKVTIFLNLILLIVPVYSEIPSYIKVCGRRNPRFNECVKESVEQLRGKLAEGMPEFHVPSVEPLDLPSGLTIANASSFRARADHVQMHGITGFELKNINFDPDAGNIDIDLSFKKMKVTGTYHIATRILVPIVTNGPIEIVTESSSAKVNMKFKLVSRKDGVHMFFTSMTCKITISGYESRYVPQEGDSAALAEAVNEILNANKKEVINSIASDIEKDISAQVLSIANKVAKRFTYDDLLPDRE